MEQQQSERTEEQMQKMEEKIRRMQERRELLKKRMQKQEQKEHEKWLKNYERILMAEFGSKYHILYTPQEAAQAFLMKEQAVPEGVMLTGRVVEEMDRKTGEAYAGENIET